jgi:molybdopterin-guanine dinucleotide biosynthesis protein A
MSSPAGIVLVGGRSSRMGTPKAALEWHGSTLLRRTVGIISRVTGGPVVVVRAPGQALPTLPPRIEVVDDPREGLGPVQGLAAGLAAVADRAEIAFVSSTDLPFLHPAFVRRVLRAMQDGADVGLPLVRGYPQPLAASYRTALAPVAERLAAQRRLRPAFLFEACTVARLGEDALRADPVLAALDPDLDSVININAPADYQAARGRPAPEVTIQRSGSLAGGERGPWLVRAATVAGAASAAGLEFGGPVVAALNGEPTTAGQITDEQVTDEQVTGGQVITDGQTPLVTGDTVFFRSAGRATASDLQDI